MCAADRCSVNRPSGFGDRAPPFLNWNGSPFLVGDGDTAGSSGGAVEADVEVDADADADVGTVGYEGSDEVSGTGGDVLTAPRDRKNVLVLGSCGRVTLGPDSGGEEGDTGDAGGGDCFCWRDREMLVNVLFNGADGLSARRRLLMVARGRRTRRLRGRRWVEDSSG